MEFGPFNNRNDLEQIVRALIQNYGKPDSMAKVPGMAAWVWHKNKLLLTAFRYREEGMSTTTDCALYCPEEMFQEVDELFKEINVECDIWENEQNVSLEELLSIPEEFFQDDEEPNGQTDNVDFNPHQTAMRFLLRHLQNKIGPPDTYIVDQDTGFAVWFKKQTMIAVKKVYSETGLRVSITHKCPPGIDEKIAQVLEKFNLQFEMIAERSFETIERELIDEPDYNSIGSLLHVLMKLLHKAQSLLQDQEGAMTKVFDTKGTLLASLEELRASTDALATNIRQVVNSGNEHEETGI